MSRVLVELTQNRGDHSFKDTNELWTSVNKEQKNLFQGMINASVLEDNICESRGITMQLDLYCFCEVVNVEYKCCAI